MIKVLITGTTSGIGKAAVKLFRKWPDQYDVFELNRDTLDLSDWDAVKRFRMPKIDVLINNAGGRQEDDLDTVLTNFLSPMTLARKAYEKNIDVTIINNTSSFVHTYWGNDLVYSASKKALAEFRKDFLYDNPGAVVHEIRPGLTLEKGSERYNEFILKYPQGSYIKPEEVAEVMMYAVDIFKPTVYDVTK